MMQPYRMADDLSREPVPGKGGGLGHHPVSLADLPAGGGEQSRSGCEKLHTCEVVSGLTNQVREEKNMSRDEVDSAGTLCGGAFSIGRNALPVKSAVLAALLFGCAVSPAPESINASYVSSIPYQSWTCAQLGQEQSSLNAALTSASAQQQQTRSDERVRSALSMLVPLPPDTGITNVTSQVEIAHLKGEREAVRQAAAYNSCANEPIPTPNAVSVSTHLSQTPRS
jgi:hypothetical protein